jgi:hypothetical protein
MTIINKEAVAVQIRNALECRLANVLGIDPKTLPALSLSEIIGVIFAVHGFTNSIGRYDDTVRGIRELVGNDLYWERPQLLPEPSALVQ